MRKSKTISFTLYEGELEVLDNITKFYNFRSRSELIRFMINMLDQAIRSEYGVEILIEKIDFLKKKGGLHE